VTKIYNYLAEEGGVQTPNFSMRLCLLSDVQILLFLFMWMECKLRGFKGLEVLFLIISVNMLRGWMWRDQA